MYVLGMDEEGVSPLKGGPIATLKGNRNAERGVGGVEDRISCRQMLFQSTKRTRKSRLEREAYGVSVKKERTG